MACENPTGIALTEGLVVGAGGGWGLGPDRTNTMPCYKKQVVFLNLEVVVFYYIHTFLI